MIQNVFGQFSTRTLLAGTFALFSLPFTLVILFPAQLDKMMDIGSYVAFHNTAEFFSIMVALCVFSVGWFTYDQSKDRHALFLGTAFLAVGLIDFMHTLSNAAMPAFITPNSTNKSTQFWISARLLDASAFLVSAFIYHNSQSRFLSKKPLMTISIALTGATFIGFTFFQSYMPVTAIHGVGLTPLKRYAEYLVIVLLIAAFAFYWRRMQKTGDRTITNYLAAFIICIFSEAAFASYTTGFDTYNVVGHIYKIIAFYLIYNALFVAAVKNPYIKLKEYTTKLEQSNQDLLDFSFVASHDLQEPLRKIRTFADRLKSTEKERISDRGVDFLEKMGNSASRMQDLISDLRRYSGSQIGLEPMVSIDLKECALEAIADLKELCERMEGTVEVGELPHIEANRVQMRELFQNLICNALKYCSREKPLVKVYSGARCPDGSLEIHVQDNGIGFDECYLDRIFKPFQRLHGRSSPYEGTGIGLAICRKIVERHNGSITATSEPGKGSTFIVRLPQVQMGKQVQPGGWS
ncbi:MAG: MASE3 domain-containing protein [Syntrophobacteraceae bacterium]